MSGIFLFRTTKFFEKYASSCHFPSTYCCKTAPIAKSDASVNTASGAPGAGYDSIAASARLFLQSSKALTASSFQERTAFPFIFPSKRSCNGAYVTAALGKHRLLKFTVPKKRRSSFAVCGLGNCSTASAFSGKGLIPFSDTSKPRNFTMGSPHTHFAELITTPL